MFKFIRGAFHSTVFLVWLVVALATTTVSAGIWAVSATYQVGAAAVQFTAAAAAHRRQLARAVLRTKARARLRRFVVAIPVAGVAAVAVFEELDNREWAAENPDGSRADYG